MKTGLFRWCIRFVRRTGVYIAMGGAFIPFMLWSKSARADMNLIDAFLDSHDFDCLNLWIEGFCLFFVVRFTWYGMPTFTLEVTPRISHRNPDALVSVTGRLGNSPSDEIQLLYNKLELAISKPIVELVSGQDVPDLYDDPDETSAKAADSTGRRAGAKSSYNYSEVVIVGAPGNAFTLHAEGLGSLGEIPANLVEGTNDVISDAVNIPATVADVIHEVNPATAGNVDDLAEESDSGHFSNFLTQWQEADFQPTEFAQYILGEEFLDYLGIATDLYSTLDEADFNIGTVVDDAITGATDEVNEAVDEIGDVLGDVNDYLADEDAEQQLIDELEENPPEPPALSAEDEEELAELITEGLSTLDIVQLAEELNSTIEEAEEYVSEFLEKVEDIKEFIDSVSDMTGAGFKMHGFKSFCPREVDIFKPYYASGTDVIGWRWRLPELVFPHTYLPAFSLSDQNVFGLPGIDTTVYNVGKYELNGSGLFGTELGFPVYNHWGPIYPRAGGVLQADVTKARAVAASRAMHIATRSGQVHIYNYLFSVGGRLKRDKWYYEYFPGPFNPQDERTGSWQLLEGGTDGGDHSCMKFGDVDDILPTVNVTETVAVDGEGNEVPQFSFGTESYSNVANSKDSRLLFNVWRQYECCQRPDPSNGWSRFVSKLDVIPRFEVPL